MIFSSVVVAVFKEFIHKFLKVYLEYWTVFNLLRDHVEFLRLMLDEIRQHHISLNLNNCVFCAPFIILLGHMVCKQGSIVDPTNITFILDLQPPTLVKHLHETLGNIEYYKKIIKGDTQITTPMEKLLKK
jgi:hypothetical protein